jgi:hypothetical protein
MYMAASDARAAKAEASNPYLRQCILDMPLVNANDYARAQVLSAGAAAAADICEGLEGAALRRAVAAVHEAGRQCRLHLPQRKPMPVFEPSEIGVAGLDDAHVPDWQDGG